MKLKVDFKVTQDFSINEFLTDADTHELTVQEYVNLQSLCEKLQLLRNVVGEIHINSGLRGEAYNKKIKGSVDSHHIRGLAADIRFDFSSWNRTSLEKVLKSIGFTNVNFYLTQSRKTWVWLHVDIGKTWNGKDFYYRNMDAVTQKEIS